MDLKEKIADETEEEMRARQAKAALDPQRPLYHYQPPPSWMNDPIPFFWKGHYHVFNQHSPKGRPWWCDMNWSHAVSEDLAHWTYLSTALSPTPGGPDKDGCFTGCVVDHDGVPTIMYTGVNPEVQCLATSEDMIEWGKYPANPVIAGPPKGLTVVGFRDPCAWKEGDAWYAIIGSGIEGVGGISLLYKSEDMVRWEYMHPLYEPDKTPGRGMHECPDFFPLDGKHILLTSAVGTHWDVGTYADHKFTSEKHGRIDRGNYYAAKTILDGRGRRIIWGWIQEGRPQDEATAAGWSGVLSLPRILKVLPDDSLGVEPVPELETLRGNHWSYRDVKISGTELLDGIEGDCIEVLVKFAPGGGREFGIILQGSDRISYDREKGQVVGAPLNLSPDEEMTLRVYVDRSVTEIFANGRVSRTLRTYHKPGDDKGVRLFTSGGSLSVESIDVWEIKAAPVKYLGGI